MLGKEVPYVMTSLPQSTILIALQYPVIGNGLSFLKEEEAAPLQRNVTGGTQKLV